LLYGIPAYRPPSVAAQHKGSRHRADNKRAKAGISSAPLRRGPHGSTDKAR
jgi:hypothetical protein